MHTGIHTGVHTGLYVRRGIHIGLYVHKGMQDLYEHTIMQSSVYRRIYVNWTPTIGRAKIGRG